MAEEWLRYQGTGVVRLKIAEGRITATASMGTAVLQIPITWEQNYDLRNKGVEFELGIGSAEILGPEKQRWAVSFPLIEGEGRYPSIIEFPIGATQAEEIERVREGRDLSLVLQIRLLAFRFQRSPLLPAIPGSAPTFPSRAAIETWTLEAFIPLTIPRSQYEEKILPYFGLSSPTVLIISVPPGARDLFAEPMRELQRAQKTLQTATTEEQFASVVSLCRNVVNALLSQFHFDFSKLPKGTAISFGVRVEALEKEFLEEVLSSDQAESVGKILNTLWRSYSGATKPGPHHHSKAYATFALHQAASLVQLLSEVLWTKQKHGK